MIRINLSQDELSKAQGKKGGILSELTQFTSIRQGNFKRNARKIFTYVIAGALGFLPALFCDQYRTYIERQHTLRMKQYAENIASLQQAVEKLKPFQEELKSYEKQRLLVRDRLGIVRELLEFRATPVNVLDALGQSLPSKTWISTVDLGLTADNLLLTVKGQAYSNEEISDFIDKMTESVHLGDVSLGDVSVKKVDEKVEVKSFTITARPKVKVAALSSARPTSSVPGAPGAANLPGVPGAPPAPVAPAAMVPPPSPAAVHDSLKGGRVSEKGF